MPVSVGVMATGTIHSFDSVGIGIGSRRLFPDLFLVRHLPSSRSQNLALFRSTAARSKFNLVAWNGFPSSETRGGEFLTAIHLRRSHPRHRAAGLHYLAPRGDEDELLPVVDMMNIVLPPASWLIQMGLIGVFIFTACRVT